MEGLDIGSTVQGGCVPTRKQTRQGNALDINAKKKKNPHKLKATNNLMEPSKTA